MRLRLVSGFPSGWVAFHEGSGLLTKNDRYDGQSERDYGRCRLGGEGIWR
jgi:hypothetical protein